MSQFKIASFMDQHQMRLVGYEKSLKNLCAPQTTEISICILKHSLWWNNIGWQWSLTQNRSRTEEFNTADWLEFENLPSLIFENQSSKINFFPGSTFLDFFSGIFFNGFHFDLSSSATVPITFNQEKTLGNLLESMLMSSRARKT